jgi:cytochrome c oxidase subunit 2
VSYRRRLPRRLLLAAPLVTTALVLLPGRALAAGSGLSPLLPNAVSPNGRNLYDLYNQISIPALFVFALIEGLLLTIIIRDRRRRHAPGYRPPQWHSNRPLEVVWTVIPIGILVVIGWLSFNELQTDFQKPADAATDLSVTVTAHRFGWTYTYQQGFSVTSEGEAGLQPLIVPTGKLVRLQLDSTDVIHSFWVPDIGGKTDAVPGYDNFTWFKIDQPGQWRGQCTELCGVGHNTMQVVVQAVSPADFAIWAAEEESKAAPKPAPTPSPSVSASPSAAPSPSASASPGASPSPSPSARPSPSPSR